VSTLTADGSSDNTGTSAIIHRPTAHATEATWRACLVSPLAASASATVAARRLPERPPGEVKRPGNARGTGRGHDEHREVVAAPPDPAVHVHGDGRSLLLARRPIAAG
jgi:hypothetical protein